MKRQETDTSEHGQRTVQRGNTDKDVRQYLVFGDERTPGSQFPSAATEREEKQK